MSYQHIIVQEEERFISITLNRPDALNSISLDMMTEIEDFLEKHWENRNLCALTITGTGRAFCAGMDLKSAQKRILGDDPDAANVAILDRLRRVLLKVEQFPTPVIAAVNGLALAGGLEFVLACDLVIAAKSAKFGDAHANYGLVPGGGSSVRLPRKIGPTRAKQMIYTGNFFEADILADWGLVNEVVEDDQLEAAVIEFVGTLAKRSPIGLKRMKRMVDDGMEQSLEAALRYELSLNAIHARSDDRIEGLAAFNEKRTPKFTGK